jgi:hypothetical protein
MYYFTLIIEQGHPFALIIIIDFYYIVYSYIVYYYIVYSYSYIVYSYIDCEFIPSRSVKLPIFGDNSVISLFDKSSLVREGICPILSSIRLNLFPLIESV